MKKNLIINALVIFAVEVLIGILFIVIPAANIISALFVIFGLLVIIINIPTLFAYLPFYNTDYKAKYNVISSVANIILGIVMIFWQNEFFILVVAALCIVFPIIRICLSASKKAQFKQELVKLILGVVILVLGPWQMTDLIFDIFGYIIIGLAVVQLVCSLVQINKAKPVNNKSDKVIIDAEIKDKE